MVTQGEGGYDGQRKTKGKKCWTFSTSFFRSFLKTISIFTKTHSHMQGESVEKEIFDE